MILEIIFILNLVVAFVAARSIQIADRGAGGHYYIEFEDSKFLTLLGYCLDVDDKITLSLNFSSAEVFEPSSLSKNLSFKTLLFKSYILLVFIAHIKG